MAPPSRSKAPNPAHEALVERMEEILQRRRGISRRRMFGGTCFLVNGNMACGVTGDGTLMVRVGAARHEAALALKGARPMDFTGRPMKGFVFVGQPHLKKTDDLKAWVLRGLEFGRALPAK